MIATFFFYSKGNGKHTIFAKGIRHCNVICFDGCDYLLFSMERYGIAYRRIKARSVMSLIKKYKNVDSLEDIFSVHVREPQELSWLPIWGRSCNEICRYVTGIDVGFTFNPTHFIKKLIKYNNTTNYEILYHWSK